VGEDGLLAQSDAEHVGTVAFSAGVPIRELRPADGAGLEEIFLSLTSGHERDLPATQPLERKEGALA
jgi:ABC-2 type transport system ATP-binding protein